MERYDWFYTDLKPSSDVRLLMDRGNYTGCAVIFDRKLGVYRLICNSKVVNEFDDLEKAQHYAEVYHMMGLLPE